MSWICVETCMSSTTSVSVRMSLRESERGAGRPARCMACGRAHRRIACAAHCRQAITAGIWSAHLGQENDDNRSPRFLGAVD